ncbi:protein Abitram-like isoform X1 [Gordionus sp. m RMFG-2023]|uniref:protein Abitram-like isoform X1 n=1 Tax=Gordionus sp. m RMFG-2023 TaxID=3053472 RepID=UPI0031FC821A
MEYEEDNLSKLNEKYYTKIIDKDFIGNDICLLKFSNKIIVITLAPSHPLIISDSKIKNIDFQISKKVNRLKNKVSGKGKKGAQVIKLNSLLCTIETEENIYKIYPACEGKLIEINENLITNPDLLLQKPDKEGYIAIILPKLE